MFGCNRYNFYSWLRISNVVVNMFGAGMIIYCLWLLKKFNEGVVQLPYPCCLPRPWFIYVCLGGGIVVCLITLSGHMVAIRLTMTTLSVYLVAIFSLVLLQAGVVVTILFRTDWKGKIVNCLDNEHDKFRNFLIFHLVLCRLITISVLVAQINIAVIATILRVQGGENTIYSHINSLPVHIRQSFLLDHDTPVLLDYDHRSLEEILKSYMEGIFTRSSYRIRTYQT